MERLEEERFSEENRDKGGSRNSWLEQVDSLSGQVTEFSLEWMANAKQFADMSTQASEMANTLGMGVEQQLQEIEDAKQHVDGIFENTSMMGETLNEAAAISEEIAGELGMELDLLDEAAARMGSVEQCIRKSASAIRALLGECERVCQMAEGMSVLAKQAAALVQEAGNADSLLLRLQEEAQEVEECRNHFQRTLEDMDAEIQEGCSEAQEGMELIHAVHGNLQELMGKVDGICGKMQDMEGSAAAVEEAMACLVGSIDQIDTVSRSVSENAQAVFAVTEEQAAANQELAAGAHFLASLAGKMQETAQNSREA